MFGDNLVISEEDNKDGSAVETSDVDGRGRR